MKIKLSFVIAIVAMASLSSCWEFNRQQRMKDADANGRATLLEAENSKKALIEQARAENEAATLQAQAKVKIAEAEAAAEVVRAKGVAEANKIIGESLKGNEAYLRYLWINGINDGNGERIYIPTEANLPILEAK